MQGLYATSGGDNFYGGEFGRFANASLDTGGILAGNGFSGVPGFHLFELVVRRGSGLCGDCFGFFRRVVYGFFMAIFFVFGVLVGSGQGGFGRVWGKWGGI